MFAATDRYSLRRSLPCLCIMGRVTGQARAKCYSGASPRQTNGLPRPDWDERIAYLDRAETAIRCCAAPLPASRTEFGVAPTERPIPLPVRISTAAD
jgi:hypothetical protein